jgi:protein TonB
MKNKLSIYLLGIALVMIQACVPTTEKKEESTEESTVMETSTVTTAEIRASAEKARMELAEQRRLDLEELSKTTPYYTLANGKIVYNKAETPPSYTGGEAAMKKYLKDNLEFPPAAVDEGKEGTVFVDFIVGSDGAVRDATATSFTYEEVEPAFQTEALRVVNAMPLWIPGRQQGKPVDVKFSVPITFRLL